MQFETTIAYLLRTGVSVAAAVVLLSGVCYLTAHGADHADYSIFHASGYSAISVWNGMRGRDCTAMIEFGLLLLIATPVLRVAVSLIGFLLERDYRFAVLTLGVLVILIGSLTF